jgi:hypothetical protein
VSGRRDGTALGALALLALYFGFGVVWVRGQPGVGLPATDVYALFYPKLLYAWSSLRAGSGLLWNPYQDCGQPFFGSSHPGLLYPLNWIFVPLDREPALIASVILHLVIAGAGTFLLCRTLGLETTAALCGAIAFQLSSATVALASWSPMHIGPYAWLPVVMWLTERLVQRATPRRTVGLALGVAIQLLPWFPQISVYTVQLVALRVVWAVLTREVDRPLRLLAATGTALVLPLPLLAVQLLPLAEVARLSVRNLPLQPSDLGPGFSWPLLWLTVRSYLGAPGTVVAALLAVGALAAPRDARRRRQAIFWALITLVFFVLSLGQGTPFWTLYARLPLAAAFRGAGRLLWIASFALAVLAALGVDAVVALASRWPRRVSLVRAGLLAGVIAGYTVFGPTTVMNLRPGDLYGASAPALDFVRAQLTPQDRMLTIGRYGTDPDFALVPKIASIARIPSIFDYEPQVTRAYADFFTFMRTGRPMQRLDDWYWIFHDMLSPTLQRPLFDLVATRWVLVDRSLDATTQALPDGLGLVAERGYVGIYENEQALARARWVPRVVVMQESDILPALARGAVDARRVAVLDRIPPSGFVGIDPDATGSAAIVGDDPERVVVRVEATVPGFLFLADQDFPGWRAQVNGVPRPILRADYTFRAVEVPAGPSDVVFTYSPWSVRLGAIISLATVAALVPLAGRRTLRRPDLASGTGEMV